MKVQCPCGSKFVFEPQPEMLAQPRKFVCAGCGQDWSDFINGMIRQELMGAGTAPQTATSTSASPSAPATEIAPPPGLRPYVPTPAPTAPAPITSAPPAPAPIRVTPVTAAPAPIRVTPVQPAPAPVAPALVAPAPAPVPRVHAVSLPKPAPAEDQPITIAPAPAPPPRVRLHTGARPAEEAAPVTDARFCTKHPGHRATEECVVCHKPLCPKCMELFGFVCSPLCKQKAEYQGIAVPEFAGQKSVKERKHWRKVGLASAGIAVLVLGLIGAWAWYEFVGSRPHPSFSYRFNDSSYSGRSYICGKDQIVFLHGGTLARHDMKSKKEIWSQQLVDKKVIEEQVEQAIKGLQAAQKELDGKNPDADRIKIPGRDKLLKEMMRQMEGSLDLYVRGQNIWVANSEKLVRYDWDTGKASQEIPLAGGLGGALARGDEMLLLSSGDTGGRAVVHINLATGQKRLEEMSEPAKTALASVPTKSGGKPDPAAAVTARTIANSAASRKLDPDKISAQAQSSTLPGKLALPATVGIAQNQEKLMAEMRGDNDKAKGAAGGRKADFSEHFILVPGEDGFAEFSRTLLEEKIVARSAMKPKPKKSALEGNVNAAATMEIANEILNEMKRNAGDDTVEEDESRYAVAVRLPCAKDCPEWRGEVNGPPALRPLKTVNVITAGKSVTVLDKTNKKKWSATLTFPVSDAAGSIDEDNAPVGLGPCVERGNILYVIDQGVLSAFDVATGNAHWRLPSVGIAGLFFDDDGMIYVNTTTASPDKLKYSKQIDVMDQTAVQVLKLDPKTGKTLWTAEPGGMINHLSGKFIYTFVSHERDEDYENDYLPAMGPNTPSHMRIKRINPKNGKVMWSYFQERSPLDIQFDKNTIHLVFKKEVQVLKFLSF